jgi:hypothetical protein
MDVGGATQERGSWPSDASGRPPLQPKADYDPTLTVDLEDPASTHPLLGSCPGIGLVPSSPLRQDA